MVSGHSSASPVAGGTFGCPASPRAASAQPIVAAFVCRARLCDWWSRKDCSPRSLRTSDVSVPWQFWKWYKKKTNPTCLEISGSWEGTVPFEQWCFSHYGPVLFTGYSCLCLEREQFYVKSLCSEITPGRFIPQFRCFPSTEPLSSHFISQDLGLKLLQL